MLTDLFTAISIGFFLSFVLGPVFFVLIETSITKGFRAAISLDLGVVLADVFLLYFVTTPVSNWLIILIINQVFLFLEDLSYLFMELIYLFKEKKKTKK